MRCDDLVFQSDTITNPMRYRTRATWWRSRPAHNLQRSNGAGSPCHPRTPPKAAQPKAQSPQPVKKGVLGCFNYLLHAARAGKGALREMCGSSMPLMSSKGALTEHPPGAGAPTGHPPGGWSVPYSGKPTFVTLRLTSSIRQARLRTTPFSHAFRPRFPATPKPRHSATSFSHAFRPCLPTCHSCRGRYVTPKRPKTFRSRIFAIIEVSEAQVLGKTQLHFADANFDIPRARPFTMSIRLKARRISRIDRSSLPCLYAVSTMSRAFSYVDFRTDTLLWRQELFGPLFRQTDFCDTKTYVLDSASTSLDYAFQPRLPTTLSGHAEATPFSHVFQPRLPAMSSDVPFGSRTLRLCHSHVRN